MDFINLAKKRYSVRKYESKKVEQEKLDKILEAGWVAPTAANLQPQRIIVINTEAGLKKLKKGANIFSAPLALVVCSDHSVTWKRPGDKKDTADIDASIITTHMMLEATNLGLGSLWICYFDLDAIKAEFDLPESVEPINILAIGYAAGTPLSPERHSAVRHPLENIVRYYD